MKNITIAALLMLLATSALAILDNTPDTISIYLDTGAEERCVQDLVDGDTDFDFYMIITNPTFDTMETFLGGYHFDLTASVNSASLAHAGASDWGSLGDHYINYDSPVPASSEMLLMTISATYHSYEYESALLYLHGISLADKTGNAPGIYTGAGDYVELHLINGENVTVRINADCGPVATESHTFDSIKSMYR